MDAIKQALDGRIDFEGQALSEKIAYALLVVAGVLAYIVTIAIGSIKTGLIVFAAGYVVTLLAVVPPWPMYRKHPVKWLPVRRLKTE